MNLAPLLRFPCTDAKRPLMSAWQRNAGHFDHTTWPLVGVPTGSINGFDVVDVDVEGLAWFEANRRKLMPRTLTHRTRSGGLHLLYRHHAGLRCSTSRIAQGVDVRADGGFVVWWPREGFAVEGRGVAPWPDWLLRLAIDRKRSPLRSPITSKSSPEVDDGRWAKALAQLDPVAWRNSEGTAEGYDRWILFMVACKAAGISVEDFVQWSTSDPVYADDGDEINRKWESVEGRHDGVLRAALKEAGISIPARKELERDGAPLEAKPTPTRNVQRRTSGLLDWLALDPSEQRLFNVACVFGEMIAEGKLKPSVATKLLMANCGSQLRRELGKEGCARTIANGLRHVEEKALAAMETKGNG